MAIGLNETITGILTLTDRYQLTDDDDILTITGADITFFDPAGEIFLGGGNDTVMITGSTITSNSATGGSLAFYLGSGSDTMTLNNSTLNTDFYAGSGDDTILIASPHTSTISKKFSLGTGDDTLTLVGILAGTGTLDFGDGVDTLIFDGGSLLTTGNISNLANLTVSAQGGTLGCDLTLNEGIHTVTFNGNLTGDTAKHRINFDGGTVTLNTADNVRTNIGFRLGTGTVLTQNSGSLTFYKIETNAIAAGDDTVVNLSDIRFIDNTNTNGYSGGVIYQAVRSIMTLINATFSNNRSNRPYISGGVIYQGSDNSMTLINATFSNNRSDTVGGVICQGSDNSMTLNNATFDKNSASTGGAIYQGFSNSITLNNATFDKNSASTGGAIASMGSVLELTDTQFTDNVATGSNNRGGAIYLEKSTTMRYAVSEGNNIGNGASSGGFIYFDNSQATFDVAGTLTVGDDTGKDSIAGNDTSVITKTGTGIWTVKSDIAGFKGTWRITEGALKLERIVRTITLDKWTIGTEGELHLSVLNDTVNMGVDTRIDGTLNLGGGSDIINTNGHYLSGGSLRVSTLTMGGDGTVSSEIMTRTADEAFDLTLTGLTLESDIIGAATADRITVTQTSALNGRIELGDGDNRITAVSTTFGRGIVAGSGNDTIALSGDSAITGTLALGGGRNYVTVTKNLDMSGGFLLDAAGETHLVVYNGASLSENTLNLYSPEGAPLTSVSMDWSAIPDLDKVRLAVSSDPTFRKFEFTVELYNQTKAFTLNLPETYFIQFQAQDEDGWAQRLLPDTVAPNQVTGVVFQGQQLTWSPTHDNVGGNGVKQYTVQVATDSAFSHIIESSVVTGTEYPLTYASGTYYARVCAEDYTGNVGEWSATVDNGAQPPTPTSTVAEVILTITDPNHDYYGAMGGWKVQDDQTVAWQDLTSLGAGYSYLGLGRFTAGKAMPDIYVYNAGASYIAAYITDDTGAITGFETAFLGSGALGQVGLADFNADGVSDLLLRTEDGFVGYYANGAFSEVQGLGLEWTVTALGDVDGNGRADVVIAHDAGYVGAYLIGNDGSISWADLGNLDANTRIVGAGDVNADGTDDVIVQVGSNYYGAWLCDNGAVTGFFGIGTFDANVQDIADYNGDGTDDLLLRTAGGVVGAALITGADATAWAEYGALGDEWSIKGVGIL